MADQKNNVRKLRESQLMSKAELARKAGLSPLTIDRVEAGKPSRMDTKRKIILALGLKLTDRHKVFPEDGDTASASPTEEKREGKGPASGRRKRVRRRRSGPRPSGPGKAEGGTTGGAAEPAADGPRNNASGSGRTDTKADDTQGDPASNDDAERKAIAGGGVRGHRLEAPGRGGKVRFW